MASSGVRIRGRVITPMPHARYFRMLRTHLLLGRPPTGELATDRALVYEALREGRAFLALDVLAPSSGFDFWAESSDGQVIPMGAAATAGEWDLRATAPRACAFRVIRDGESYAEADGTVLDQRVGTAGVYRVEAVLTHEGHERTWIVSNPIYLREES